MENKMIERDDAVRLLYSVIRVSSDDVAELYTSVRTDADEYKAHCDLCDELYQRYHFVPSEYETAQETESIKEGMTDEYPDSAE